MLIKDEGNFLEPPFVPKLSSPIRLKDFSDSESHQERETQKLMGALDPFKLINYHVPLWGNVCIIKVFPTC